MSYGSRIRALAAGAPDAIPVTVVARDGHVTPLTWRRLDADSNRLARALARRGAGVGERIGLELPNSPEMVIGVLAAWKIGAAPVPVRWDLPDWERNRVAEVLDAAVLIRPEDMTIFDEAAAEPDGALPDIVGPAVNGICSSGSTGTPKIIMDETPALFDPALAQPFPSNWGVQIGAQRILVPTALYHTNGFATFTHLLRGDSLTILEKFDAARAVEVIEQVGITTFTATPTMLWRIAQLPGIAERDLSSLVWVLQGAAVFPAALTRTWIGLIGAERLYMSYGMTERLGLAAIRGDEWLAHPGSVGRGFRDTEIRILDAEGRDLPAGEVGEIYLRSPTTGRYGYLGASQPLPMTADGFATAGDLGRLDADGFLYIADRRVDMIVTGGANVFPAEVEAAVSEHPGVADVVVIGLRDEEWGRRVHALVEPADPRAAPSAQEIRAFAKGRLAGYKVPKTVEIVDVIPRSAATKVNRSELVAQREVRP